jgi:hypothetical protein
MKLFFITVIMLWSLILPAQNGGNSMNETFLTDNLSGLHQELESYNSISLKHGIPLQFDPYMTETKAVNSNSENTKLQIHPSFAIDSSIIKSFKYQYWYKISLVEFGINYNTANTSASASNKLNYGQAVINYSMGFQRLGGLGFGSKLIVYYAMPDNVEIHSWVPLYTYFPVYISRKETKPFTRDKNTYNIPFMINLYAGGSLWCTTSSSYRISEGAFLPGTFYHVGVNCMFFNYSVRRIGFLNGNFALDTGMLFYKNRDGALTSVFNIGLQYSFAAGARLIYK